MATAYGHTGTYLVATGRGWEAWDQQGEEREGESACAAWSPRVHAPWGDIWAVADKALCDRHTDRQSCAAAAWCHPEWGWWWRPAVTVKTEQAVAQAVGSVELSQAKCAWVCWQSPLREWRMTEHWTVARGHLGGLWESWRSVASYGSGLHPGCTAKKENVTRQSNPRELLCKLSLFT